MTTIPGTENDTGLTRREAIVSGVTGAAVMAGAGAAAAAVGPSGGTLTSTPQRMPVAYVPHGGGPWPFVDMGMDKSQMESLSTYLRQLRELPNSRPKAMLVISAHWEQDVPTVMTSPQPGILYDYYGFPAASYTIKWPAKGHPDVAARVQELLGAAGFKSAADGKRGYDHGTFIPFKLTYPDADIPTLQLSLQSRLDPKEHIAMGRALAPLRDEGVFIVGSGMSFHNLRLFGHPRANDMAAGFDAWLQDAATLSPAERDMRLASWASAPSARAAHPREEHLLPLMVVAGAAGEDRGRVAFSDRFMDVQLSAYHFG